MSSLPEHKRKKLIQLNYMERTRNNPYRHQTPKPPTTPQRIIPSKVRGADGRYARDRAVAIARSNSTRKAMLETRKKMNQIKKTSEGFENSNGNENMILLVIILLIIVWTYR